MSVFVELVKGLKSPGSYSYKITMKKIDSEYEEEDLVKEYVSLFENQVCWGYNRFYKIEELQMNHFLDP